MRTERLRRAPYLVVTRTSYRARVSLALLVVCGVACTGGGAKDSANPGPCPEHRVIAGPTLNAGIRGLDKRLVPIDAVFVRICEYDATNGTLDGSSEIRPPREVERFEDETNRLPLHTPDQVGCERLPPSPFVVTFATPTQRVDVVQETEGCELFTNGVRPPIDASFQWSGELQRYIRTHPTRR